jgi:hypothetical protein
MNGISECEEIITSLFFVMSIRTSSLLLRGRGRGKELQGLRNCIKTFRDRRSLKPDRIVANIIERSSHVMRQFAS